MKKLFLVIILLSGINVYGQEVYVGVSAGYSYLPQQNNYPKLLVNNYHSIIVPWMFVSEKISFKHVFLTELTLGHELKSGLGYEVAGAFLKPQKVSLKYDLVEKNMTARSFRVNPRITLNHEFNKLTFISKFGVIVGFGRLTYSQYFQNNNSFNLGFEESTLVYQYKTDPFLGFNASIGVKREITPRVSWFAELSGVYQSLDLNSGKMIEHTLDDSNQLELYDWNMFNSQIEFGDEQDFATFTPMGNDRPQKISKQKFSLSGFGFNLGIRFTLWNGENNEN